MLPLYRRLSLILLPLFLFLILILLLLLIPRLFTSPADRHPRRYRIQLDSPASSRWDHIVDDHVQYIPLFQENVDTFPDPVKKTALMIAANIRDYFPLEYALEVEGIASRSCVPLAYVVAFTILYDVMAYDRKHALFQGCTSIVACDDKGRILHGRNFDYGLTKLMEKITILVDFYRGEKLLYTGTTFVFYVGVQTGQRPGGFTVSLNARYSGTYASNVQMQNILKFRTEVGIVIRETLEKESTFSAAVKRLTTAYLICPAYLTVGGVEPFEGAVITRDRWNRADVQRLSKDNWYLVQTNYDHWQEDGDMRRTIATQLLSDMGRSRLNAQSLFGVLSTPPVRNNVTIFSGVLSAANPSLYYDTTVMIEHK